MYLLSTFLSVKAYDQAVREKRIPKPEKCPVCGEARLHWHGQYERAVEVREGQDLCRHDIPILVVKCVADDCQKRYHALLPAFVYPYRQMGPEVTEEAVHRLLTDGTKSTESFLDDQIAPDRLNRWMRWLDTSIAPSEVHRLILKRSPGFDLQQAPAVQVAEREGRWRGPIPRLWRRVADLLTMLQAFHAAGDSIQEDEDPSALRSFLRHLWKRQGLILLFAGIHPQ